MEEIIIKWYGPYKINNIIKYDISNEFGIYAIYRKFGDNMTLLYIGKRKDLLSIGLMSTLSNGCIIISRSVVY